MDLKKAPAFEKSIKGLIYFVFGFVAIISYLYGVGLIFIFVYFVPQDKLILILVFLWAIVYYKIIKRIIKE